MQSVTEKMRYIVCVTCPKCFLIKTNYLGDMAMQQLRSSLGLNELPEKMFLQDVCPNCNADVTVNLTRE